MSLIKASPAGRSNLVALAIWSEAKAHIDQLSDAALVVAIVVRVVLLALVALVAFVALVALVATAAPVDTAALAAPAAASAPTAASAPKTPLLKDKTLELTPFLATRLSAVYWTRSA